MAVSMKKIHCGKFKILNSGSSLDVPVTVRDVKVDGYNLLVVKSDGTETKLDLPPAEPANVESVRLMNASWTAVVLSVATVK